jgi:drug/metabolite transporter (DMT)-like permease
VTLLFSAIFLSEHIKLVQIAGILLVVCGVIIASGISTKKNAQAIGQGPILALVPVLTWGMGWVFISKSVTSMGWESAFLIELLVTPIVLLALTPLIKGKEQVTVKRIRKIWLLPVLCTAALIQMLSILAVNVGLSHAPSETAVVIAISTYYPALTVFLALHNLKERIPIIPLLGGLIGIAGVVLLSIGT